MSAIGGIVDFKNKEVDFSELNALRRSMSLRGRCGSSAYLCGGAGMIFNSSEQIEGDGLRQPNIEDRRGKSVALCIDSHGISPRAVSEKYFVHGTDFLGCIDGAFALSLYDEERDTLILARDRCGKKPLFYSVANGKIYFASEPKGIIDAQGETLNVNRDVLEYHLVGPMGIYRASSIYPDVCEVLAGECVAFTAFGISKFFYRKNREASRIKEKKAEKFTKERIISLYPSFEREKLSDYLNEALIAFDYPQFDCYMPFLSEVLSKASAIGKESVMFEDIVRRKNLVYAREREDRLGALYGIRAIGTFTPSQPTFGEGCMEALLRLLNERFFSIPPYDRILLREIFGQYKLDYLLEILSMPTKKEDTEKKIRILGMLCQTVEWMQARDLRFVSHSREYSAYSV